MNWGKWLDYLYPPRCPVCDRIYADGICADCRKKLFVITEDFCMKCGETAGGYTAGILPGLQQKAACIPAKSCAAVLSGTGKIVIVSDEICKPSGLCRNLRQGNGSSTGTMDSQVQDYKDHTGAAAQKTAAKTRVQSSGSNCEIYGAGITSSCR